MVRLCVFSDQSLFSLLALAEEYQIASVREKCQQYIGHQAEKMALVNWRLPIDKLLLCLLACDKFRLYEHRQKLVELAASCSIRDLANSPAFSAFPPHGLVDALHAKCVKAVEAAQCNQCKLCYIHKLR
jgi:hypothetical protein